MASIAASQTDVKVRRTALLTVPDFVFLLLAVCVPIRFGTQLLNTDGDLARHLRVGEFILSRGALFYRDHFSYTMEGQPFVPYEWLSEITFALAHRAGGLPAVAVLAGLVVAATYFLVVLFLRQRGVDPLLTLLVAMLSAVLGAVHWLARPHLFTLLGAILLLHLVERRDRRSLWLYAPLFVLWANLHGGFIYGLVVLSVYVAGDFAELVVAENRAHSWQRLKYHSAALAVAILASCINPSGPRLFSHVTGYFGKSFLIDHTQEYMSPNFHHLWAQLLLGTLVLIIWVLAVSRHRPTYPRLLLLVVSVAFALYSARNIPLFAITALPAVALGADAQWRQLPFLGRFRDAVARADSGTLVGLWVVSASVAMVALGLNQGYIGTMKLIPDQFDETRFPVAAIERARAAGLRGRMFNHFDWGGYILYAWPEQKVFIDGQTDFYGEELARTYHRITLLLPGWRQALQQWDVSLVVVNRDSPLAHELAREQTWRIWHCDQVAVILQRVKRNASPKPDEPCGDAPPATLVTMSA